MHLSGYLLFISLEDNQNPKLKANVKLFIFEFKRELTRTK